MNSIIQTHALTRDFKKTRAVNALDLTIQRGELFGLIGPDGAGKTTTLRLLAGLLNITDGNATVAGLDLKKQAEAIKPKIGYMAQRFSLYGELSVLENLHFFAELYDVPRDQLDARAERLLDFAGLLQFKQRRAGKLSGGMQKKLALACTLIHEPEILLLDEPTMGVDPVSRREFWNILTDLHNAGTTIIVSTPYMDEADRCSMVGFMYAGKLAVCAPPAQIRADVEGEIIELFPEGGIANSAAARAAITPQPGVIEVQTYGETLQILVDDGAKRLPELIDALTAVSIPYHHARIAPVRMEQAFISLIRMMEASA